MLRCMQAADRHRADGHRGRRRFVPAWVSGYQRGWFRPDVIAGVTVTAYLIPQVMAYAEVAGLPAVVGLWSLVGGLFAYAFVGSSRVLSVGPESTTALMTAAAVGATITSPEEYADLAVALSFVVAGLCVLGWAGGLARLSDLLSRPVLIGYMAGVAGIMIVSQLGKLTRTDVLADGFLPELWWVLTHTEAIHLPTLGIGVGIAALMIVGGHWWPKAPVALIGMITATALAAWTPLSSMGLELIGDIPAGLPWPSLPSLSLARSVDLIVPALGVAFVGYSDNILTARAFAKPGDRVDADRELLALGFANLGSGLMQGFPVSSSGSRTAIADAVGARSQFASVTTVLATVLAVFTLRPLLAAFPSAALGAVVVYAATRLVDVSEFRRFARFRRSEFAIAISTTLAVLVVGVLQGVLVAIAISIADLLRRVARPHDSVLGFVPGLAGMHDVDDHPSATLIPGLMVYRYDSPLFFANAENFKRRALRTVARSPDSVEWFVLNAEAIIEIDVTAADALEELRASLTDRGVVVALARLKQDLRDELAGSGLLERIGEDHIFPTLPTAVAAYEVWRESKR